MPSPLKCSDIHIERILWRRDQVDIASKSEEENWTSDEPIIKYPINNDPEFIFESKSLEKLTRKQDVFIRYLRPPTPPSPGPIIIIQEPDIVTQQAPPIQLKQKSHRNVTIEPLIQYDFSQNINEKITRIPGKILTQPPKHAKINEVIINS